MTGTILQINTSRGGIPKRPVAEAMITPAGIEGDLCAHPEFHGGPRQAVLIIASEVVERLVALGYPVFPGALGENLTVRGIDHRWFRLGQQWRAGEAVIELTKVRVPCSTLDVYGPALKREIYDAEVKAGNTASPRWAMSGVYARVVRPGMVRGNDIISLIAELA